MAEPVTDARLFAVRKSIQDRRTRLGRGRKDIRAELHGTGEHLAALSTRYAALVGDGVPRRIERSERHRTSPMRRLCGTDERPR